MQLTETTIQNAINVIIICVGMLLANDKVSRFIRKIKDKYQPHDVLIRGQIQKSLDTLRIKLGATRVNLWQANNGTDSLSGYSYKYMNIIFESYDVENSLPMKKLFKDTPVEDYLPLLLAIHKSKKYYIGNRDSDLPIVRAAYEKFGVELGVDYKFDNNDIYKGFISISYSNEKDFKEHDIVEIEQTTAMVYSLIRKIKNKK